MKLLLVALAIATSLLGAAEAEAQRMPYYHPFENGVAMPPPRYSEPYRGQLTMRVLPLAEVRTACLAAAARFNRRAWDTLKGCAIYAPGRCTVIIPRVGGDGVTAAVHQALRRHELGHCNGWRHG